MSTLDRVRPNSSPDAIAEGEPHAVVIGSGFGGLAAAVRLGAKGWRVTVLERLDAPGGRASVYRQDGFTFDAGPTIVTAPFLFEDLWRIAGRELSQDVVLAPLDPFYRLVFDDGEVLDCHADPQAMRAEVERISPNDLAGYDAFMERSQRICAVGFETHGHKPFMSLLDMGRFAPDLLWLGGRRSVHSLVSTFVKHPKLRIALSFHPLFVGGNPFDTTAVYGLICHLERRWGVHFAMGGTGVLVDGLVRLIESQGGRLRTGAEVEQILVEAGRVQGVRLTTGEVIPAELVVSNADAADTYLNLVHRRWRKRWTDARLQRAKYSMGLFVWYFGTRRRWPEVQHHTIVLGPRYRGLLDDIFASRDLASDMSLYLHRPTATDPSLAPPGCDAFYVLSPVPHLDAPVDWKSRAEPYRRAIAERLSSTVLPGFETEIVTSRVTTPLDFAERYRAVKGAAFSLAPTLLQSGWFRPNPKSEDVEGLYLVGGGTQPGAGLPGVLSSARIVGDMAPQAAHA